MGLDNIIKYYNGIEYSSNLPEEIADKFISVNEYGVVGFSINKYENHYFISFRGKAYNNIIRKLTDKSLHNDYKLNELKEMYLSLEEKINNFGDIEEVNKEYDNSWNIKDWTEYLLNMYIPSPNEIIGLKEIFRLCYDNNLILYASY